MKYVIIGNSTAGIGAVEGIRKIDTQGEITIISDEPHHTYSRPLISYLIGGKVDEQKMKYRCDDFYSENKCTLLSGVNVTAIDANAKNVELSDGKKIPYDKLLVGTGSSPFVPEMEGLDTVKNQVTFMCLDDAHALDKVLDKDKSVLIIGAGLIGLKCAEGISKSGRASKITIADLSPKVLSSILDDESSKIIRDHLESKGLNFISGKTAKKFDGNKAILGDGEEIEFDILVLAVGVRPNTSLLNGIADIQRGIIVNEKSETSAADIYAAGDCTQTTDISSGDSKIMALLPNAYIQGECAGINMAGGEKAFTKAIPMNAIGFFGLSIITAGNYTGKTYVYNSNGSYKCLFYDDDSLNGYIMVGDVDKAGIYTSLIRDKIPLSTIDFPLICEKPGLMAFTTEERKNRLAG